MISEIKITGAASKVASIEIEGMIGVPEQWQFEEPGQRVTTYQRFKERLDAIGRITSGEIVVNIRSTGGNVNDALLIHDALAALDAKIVTRCYGYVASAATIIAQAASAGQREISSNSLYLIHRSIGTVEGNSNELNQTLDLLGKTDQRLAAIYAARSGKEQAVFAELMSENNGNGRWMSPQEAFEAGLVDKIVEAAPVSNDAAKMVEELGLPSLPQADFKPKNSGMSKKWNAILEILGLGKQPGEVIDEKELDLINEELEARETKINEITIDYKSQVETLMNKVEEMEAQNARLKATASETKPKEDPSMSEIKKSANEEAYINDVRRFR